MENEKVWSNWMINDVFIRVEKWYGCLDSNIFQNSDSENNIVKSDLVIDSGSPKKIFDLGGVVIGDNEGSTTWCPWDVSSVFKEG